MDWVRRISRHPEYRRVLRGAFLAPWFAVSLGVVIAASLTLAAPHASLSFPPTKGGSCESVACPNTRHDLVKREPRRPPATEGRGDRRLPAPKTGRLPGRAVAAAPHQPAGVRIRYGLLREQAGHFMAMIVINGQKSLGPWALEFALPRARISVIMWAKWAFKSSGLVIIDGIPSPWPRSSPDQARIVIFGTGKPQRPVSCLFTGVRCAFEPLQPQLNDSYVPALLRAGASSRCRPCAAARTQFQELSGAW
jgi:hypothetical protein